MQAGTALHTGRLADGADAAGFRTEARRLLAAGVPPGLVHWQVVSAVAGDLFDAADGPPPHQPAPAAAPVAATVPASMAPVFDSAALHTDPNRFGLLYRLLWRLTHEPSLRHDPLDADRLRAERLARAVRRDKHKMTAFVRFRPVAAADDAGAQITHVAWFEPEHHIVEATAPFFARRFAQMRWAILTPQRCVRWDGQALAFGPGASRAQAPAADAAEALWLTYYASIFNPARLKLAMMRREMPVRFWKNLPEAVLIQPLATQAAARTGLMLTQPASTPQRRPAAALALRAQVQRPQGAAVPGAPATLHALQQALAHCSACPLGALATQAVPGEGPARARLMLVGEQPGDTEDLHGRPFIGPAGQLLDRALAQLQWPRDALYITNAVKHFKYTLRGKRRLHKTPAQQEAAACLAWLDHELALVQPEAVVALGATAARALLGHDVVLRDVRGRWLVRADGLRVLVTLHPAALLRMDAPDLDAAFAHWLADLHLASPCVTGAPLAAPG